MTMQVLRAPSLPSDGIERRLAVVADAAAALVGSFTIQPQASPSLAAAEDAGRGRS